MTQLDDALDEIRKRAEAFNKAAVESFGQYCGKLNEIKNEV